MVSVAEPTSAVPTAAELGLDLAALDVPGLAERHGTPLLVLDPARVVERLARFRLQEKVA